MTRMTLLSATLLLGACHSPVQPDQLGNQANADTKTVLPATPDVNSVGPVANDLSPEARIGRAQGRQGTTPVPVPIPGLPGTPARPDANPPPPHMDPDAPPPPGEKTAAGAARRLLEYCDAVATKRYRDAYALWDGGGKATGMTLGQFSDSFAKYRAYDCHIGNPGPMEGAAGSSYITVPLQVTGNLSRGGGFTLEGPITMRRVNDVPGSSAEQRRWHITHSGLKPRP
ncbi:hypothetical protein ABDK56_04730 [Sphingomonas sp. ASV193]|uniref:hypothetical protein n=1 Tax=Sphingomonas sp. ASV193 TaxID=3144405 RepID=UPI0032E8F193